MSWCAAWAVSQGCSPRSTSGEFRDATDLGLPGVQRQLVEVLIALDVPVVVVVLSGRVHSLPWLAGRPVALVYAWCPGEQGGAGLADVLCGDVDATGRLPISVPRNVGQIPVHHDHRAGGGRSQMLGDYVDSPAAPLYPFGHGLSYTTFVYDELEVSDATTAAAFTVSVGCATPANAPAPRWCSATCATRSPAWLGPASSSRASPGSTSNPARVPSSSSRSTQPSSPTTTRTCGSSIEPGAVRIMVGPLSATVALEGAEREIAPNDRRATAVALRDS